MVFGPTFRSLIHFEFILVCGIRRWSSFIFLQISVQFSQHNLLNKLSLDHCICLLPLSNIDHRGVDLFLGSLFSSIDVCVCFYVSTMLFWLLWPCSIVPLLGIYPKKPEQHDSKGHKHTYVHCSVIYNHQDMEAPQVSISRGMDKTTMGSLHDGSLLVHKKE